MDHRYDPYRGRLGFGSPSVISDDRKTKGGLAILHSFTTIQCPFKPFSWMSWNLTGLSLT